MEQLNNLDVVFLIIVGISALVGIARGMTKEVLSIIGWVLAVVVLFYLVPVIVPIMQHYVASKVLANIVAGLIILIIFAIIWILTVDRISSVIRSSNLNSLDRILGFVFGAARGVLIVVLIALLISTLIPEESKKGVFAESQYFKLAEENIEPLKNLIPESWVDAVKEKSESLGFGVAKDQTKEDEKNKAEESKEEQVSDAVSQSDATAQEKEEQSSNDDAVSTLNDNIEMLKKSGEELFNELVQPKTSAASDETEGETFEESDLDKLLDVLEDRMVTTDEADVLSDETKQKIADKVIDKVKENVADKVSK